MTITRTLENMSSESAESVDILPFARTAWVTTDAEANANAITAMESKVSGETPEFPLIRQVEIRKARVFHPSQEGTTPLTGRRYSVTIHTTQKVEDSVSGLVTFVPVQTQVSIAHGGSTILNSADVLQFLLSTVAELYNSVTDGTPDNVAMAKLALGASDI